MKRFIFLAIPFLLIASCGSVPEKKNADNQTSETAEANRMAGEKVEPTICNDLNSFVPKGWKIRENVKGDLNKDGINDVALVIQKTDTALIKKMATYSKDTNPRNLIVLFGTEKANCFELILRNSTFILASDRDDMDDPFESIYIDNGTLKLNFLEFYTVGNWMFGHFNYTWRFQDGEFKLIGADISRHHRADGDAKEVSANFSTKKYSVTTYNMFDESVKEEEVWKTLDLKELKTFQTFKAPWTVTINSDIHL